MRALLILGFWPVLLPGWLAYRLWRLRGPARAAGGAEPLPAARVASLGILGFVALVFLCAALTPHSESTAPPAAGQEYILTSAQHLRARPLARPITGPLVPLGTRVTATGQLTTHWRQVRTAAGQTGWLLRGNARAVPSVAAPPSPPATATPAPRYAVHITSDLPRAITEDQPIAVHLTVTNVGLPMKHLVLESNLDIAYWALDAHDFSVDGDCPAGPTFIPPTKGWDYFKFAFGALGHGQTCHITVHTVASTFSAGTGTCFAAPAAFGWHVYSLDTLILDADGYLLSARGYYVTNQSSYNDSVHQVDGALDQQVTIRCRTPA